MGQQVHGRIPEVVGWSLLRGTVSSIRSIPDGGSAHGTVNNVVRSGDLVRRPAGRWTRAVHSLLRHLDESGLVSAPRPISFDLYRESVSYIPGDVALRPWPSALLEDSGLRQVAEWLAAYHEAVASFIPNPAHAWRAEQVDWLQGMIVRHGDFAPWNTVWHEGHLAGVIDWDFAEPGHPIEDVAQMLWHFVPLYPPKKCAQTGIKPGRDQVRRLRILLEKFDYSAAEVVETLSRLQHREIRRIREWGREGRAPWSVFAERGDEEEILEMGEWLADHREALVGAR